MDSDRYKDTSLTKNIIELAMKMMAHGKGKVDIPTGAYLAVLKR